MLWRKGEAEAAGRLGDWGRRLTAQLVRAAHQAVPVRSVRRWYSSKDLKEKGKDWKPGRGYSGRRGAQAGLALQKNGREAPSDAECVTGAGTPEASEPRPHVGLQAVCCGMLSSTRSVERRSCTGCLLLCNREPPTCGFRWRHWLLVRGWFFLRTMQDETMLSASCGLVRRLD